MKRHLGTSLLVAQSKEVASIVFGNMTTDPDRLDALAAQHARAAETGLAALALARRNPRAKVPNPAGQPSVDELMLNAQLAVFYQSRAVSMRIKASTARR